MNDTTDPDKLIPGLTTFPNLGPPEVLPEGYKTIKLLPGQQNPPPKIQWGKKFEAMPQDKQLRRAKKVADAMNHAADVAQQRVSELIDVANHQERQLENAKQSFQNQQDTMRMMTTRHNEEQQARMQEMQEIKSERKRFHDALLLLASSDSRVDPEFVRDVLSGKWRATMEERKAINAARIEMEQR